MARILGLRGHIYGDMGAYIRTNGGVVPAKAGQFLPGPYRIRDVAITVEALMTSKTPVGTLRAPGRFEANFFRERLLDIVARDLGLDPMEFRRKNLISEAELPFATGKLVPYEGETDFDTGDYHATFERVLSEIGWAEKKSLQGRLIDGRYHGLAAVPFVESSGSGKENVRATIEDDGSVTVYVGSSVLGQGLETTLAQVAADTLKLPFERVRILHGSTTYLREGFGTFASRSMVVGGSAVMDGCGNLVAAIRAAATERFGLPNEEIMIADGVVSAGAKRATFAEFAGLEAEGSFATAIRTYSYGAHACHVAVDPRTGHVEILDYVAIEDVGRAINPDIVHGQAIGALVQGLGGVFLDQSSTMGMRKSSTRRLPIISCRWRAIFRTSAPSRWSFGDPRPIRSAPKVRAKAAWWQWRRRPRMPWPRRLLRSASSCASCRCRRRICGSS